MPEIDRLEDLNKHDRKAALSSLYQSPGWSHLEDYLLEQKDILKNRLVECDPKNSIKIAYWQGMIEMINRTIQKPKTAYEEAQE